MNEKDIINLFISSQYGDSVAIGIGDDCAVLNTTPGYQIVATTDNMIEGRHFLKQSPAYYVGYKLLATNISDIASMCAIPKWATLNLTLRENNLTWLKEFSHGLLTCAKKNNIELVGGNTTFGNELNLSLQLIGEVPKNHATLRSQAVVNDIIFVTGRIGCAAQALKQLHSKHIQHTSLNETQISALYTPPSRVNLAIELRELIHASIDISDGLLHELEMICDYNNLGAELKLEVIPIDQDIDIIDAITSGDDYELLFTANENCMLEIQSIALKYDCLVTAIGRITRANKINLRLNGEPITYPEKSGYDHCIDT